MKALPDEVKELDAEILAFIHRGVEHQDADAFNRLALEVFALQYRYLPLYRRYCERRAYTPARAHGAYLYDQWYHKIGGAG
jgi:hypothetical protein